MMPINGHNMMKITATTIFHLTGSQEKEDVWLACTVAPAFGLANHKLHPS
jgi:predicted cupin superfamily sugar epimerase